MMKQAIALSGGGAKGAYELGAWEALSETGFSPQIVTGTSIGAFNGALMVQGDLDKAIKMWETISMDQILEGFDLGEAELQRGPRDRDGFLTFLKSAVGKKKLDISPTLRLLDEMMDEECFFRSPIDFGLITVRFPTLTPVERLKQDMTPADFRQWILASCSCFPAFPLCTIDGQSYIDGGYYDNLPIETAFRMGADEVIAIDLHPEPVHPEFLHHPLVRTVLPAQPLGSLMGLQKERIFHSRRLGYLDTMRMLGRYEGTTYTFQKEDHPIDRVFCRMMTELQLRDLTKASVRTRFARNEELLLYLRSFGAADTPRACRLAAAEAVCCALKLDRETVYSVDSLLEILKEKVDQNAVLRWEEEDRLKKLSAAAPGEVTAYLLMKAAGLLPKEKG